eukprot:6209366-Pleurochrysis_carterae.AAC.6
MHTSLVTSTQGVSRQRVPVSYTKAVLTLSLTAAMFVTCLMPQLRAQRYVAKCIKTSEAHNLPSR